MAVTAFNRFVKLCSQQNHPAPDGTPLSAGHATFTLNKISRDALFQSSKAEGGVEGEVLYCQIFPVSQSLPPWGRQWLWGVGGGERMIT